MIIMIPQVWHLAEWRSESPLSSSKSYMRVTNIYESIDLTSYVIIFDVFQPVSIAEISKGQNCGQGNMPSDLSVYMRG